MRKPMAKKVLAATMAAAMTMSVAACGEKAPATTPETSTSDVTSTETSVEPEEEVSKYTVLKDENGEVYDLGGINVTIYDWFTEIKEPETNYERAQAEYREWIQETYNFTVTCDKTGDWGSNANQFVEYVNGNGVAGEAKIFCIHGGDATLLSAAQSGLCYNLQTIKTIDLNDRKYTANGVHKLYTFGDGTYAFHAGPAEPRCGIFFNKKLLKEIANVEADEIYNMQANDTWTWEAFEDLLEKCTKDLDNDGVIDVWGLTVNETNFTHAAVYSNGGVWVGMNDAGEYTYEMESENTLEALEWTYHIFHTYDWDGPVDEEGKTNWEYYKEQFVNGGAVFCADETWIANSGSTFYDMDELGFVMFPKGPKGSLIAAASDNVYVIPACYDEKTAAACALAFDLWNEYVPEYEDFNPFVNNFRTGNFDTRACEETVPLIGDNSFAPLHAIIPENGKFVNENFCWKLGPNTSETVAELLEANRDFAQQCIAEANGK